MQLYFVEKVDGKIGYLDADESRHLRDVVRLKVGDELRCTDGSGGEYFGKITRLDKKGGELLITSKKIVKPNSNLHLALAPTKNIARTELVLEKATEIGVDQITPIFCQHSERKHLRPDRLRKIIKSAAKQSQKLHFPKLNESQKCMDFMRSFENWAGQKYMAYCGIENLPLLNRIYVPDSNVLVMIGPEGDFSESEATKAREAGFQLISLGESRLRTETAAIVAATIIQQKIFSQ